MYCTNCGRKLDSPDAKCPVCDAPSELPQEPVPAEIPVTASQTETAEETAKEYPVFSRKLFLTGATAYIFFIIFNCITLGLMTEFLFGYEFKFDLETSIMIAISAVAFVGSILTAFGLFRAYSKAKLGEKSSGLLTTGLFVKLISGVLFFTYYYYLIDFDINFISVYVVAMLGLLIYFIPTVMAVTDPEKRHRRGGPVNMTACIFLILGLLLYLILFYQTAFIDENYFRDILQTKDILAHVSVQLSLVALCVYFFTFAMSFINPTKETE